MSYVYTTAVGSEVRAEQGCVHEVSQSSLD